MKVALTLAAVGAAGMLAAGDRSFPGPSQFPTPPSLSEGILSISPSIAAPFEVALPIDPPDSPDVVGSCGCGGESATDGMPSDSEWDIEGCSPVFDDEGADIPAGVPERIR